MPIIHLTPEDQLDIISEAWGHESGYVFLPWIPGDCANKDERRASYHEGRSYRWPADQELVLQHLKDHRHDDVYWCPTMFSKKHRQAQVALPPTALWADLDDADPRDIDPELRPSIAWRSSPGRYQGLWILSEPVEDAASQGGLNQRLTAFCQADKSGWDITQLLRIPGWHNHKPEYRREDGTAPLGVLLWDRGDRGKRQQRAGRATYEPTWLDDKLPTVQVVDYDVGGVTEAELEAIDRAAAYARVRMKLPQATRQLIKAREAMGDRSDKLWQMERDLADAGLSPLEIVAVVRPTVWNKFAGRGDEITRLVTEASKAYAEKGDDGWEVIDDAKDWSLGTDILAHMAELKEPDWLVQDLLPEGAVGFIAGQPKSWKSWIALDLCVSVATGEEVLGAFEVRSPGTVVYIQEEDSDILTKPRLEAVLGRDTGMAVGRDEEGEDTVMLGGGGADFDLHLLTQRFRFSFNAGVVMSDPTWQERLDEQLSSIEDIRLVVIDSLMAVAGDIEENKATAMMSQLYGPLKELARKHGCALLLVHHMKKGESSGRGGQDMLGSVANHAWSETSFYVRRQGKGTVLVERESKSASLGPFKVGGLHRDGWQPVVDATGDQDDDGDARDEGSGGHRRSPIDDALDDIDGMRTGEIAELLGMQSPNVSRRLKKLEAQGKVRKKGQAWHVIR